MLINKQSRKDLCKKILTIMRTSTSLCIGLGLIVSIVIIVRLTETRESKLLRLISPIVYIPTKAIPRYDIT